MQRPFKHIAAHLQHCHDDVGRERHSIVCATCKKQYIKNIVYKTHSAVANHILKHICIFYLISCYNMGLFRFTECYWMSGGNPGLSLFCGGPPSFGLLTHRGPCGPNVCHLFSRWVQQSFSSGPSFPLNVKDIVYGFFNKMILCCLLLFFHPISSINGKVYQLSYQNKASFLRLEKRRSVNSYKNHFQLRKQDKNKKWCTPVSGVCDSGQGAYFTGGIHSLQVGDLRLNSQQYHEKISTSRAASNQKRQY